MEFEKYDAFAKQMETRFPKMFAEPYGGFCVNEGWWPILTNLCANIQHHLDWKNKTSEVIPQVTVAQIKEKFGGLRFYYDGGDDQIQGMVTMAEAWASNTCEICGVPATKQTTGWIKTVCDKHFDENEARKKTDINEQTT